MGRAAIYIAQHRLRVLLLDYTPDLTSTYSTSPCMAGSFAAQAPRTDWTYARLPLRPPAAPSSHTSLGKSIPPPPSGAAESITCSRTDSRVSSLGPVWLTRSAHGGHELIRSADSVREMIYDRDTNTLADVLLAVDAPMSSPGGSTIRGRTLTSHSDAA
jgi:hypothetical protein